jgi:uncharacterized protein YndB with AHSA1/START domain
MSTDRIEKNVVLRAPRDRVWDAISDAKKFGTWFGMEVDGAFVAGTKVAARIVPTQVDAETAKAQEPYRGAPLELFIERVEPKTLFSFRWHPYAVDAADYAKEPTTLVTFELADAPGGTSLRITESGFDQLPPERRAQAFAANEGGWEKQTELIAKYLAL